MSVAGIRDEPDLEPRLTKAGATSGTSVFPDRQSRAVHLAGAHDTGGRPGYRAIATTGDSTATTTGISTPFSTSLRSPSTGIGSRAAA